MQRFGIFCVLICCSAFLLPDLDAEETYDQREDEIDDKYLALALRKLEERGLFDCNGLGQSCRGIVRCCGSLQCYWNDGFSAAKAGQCVECVSKTQLCQRDAQCCSPLVCQKANAYYVDGRCDARRSTGQECHEDDQCASKDCNISNWNKVKGYGGRCT